MNADGGVVASAFFSWEICLGVTSIGNSVVDLVDESIEIGEFVDRWVVRCCWFDGVWDDEYVCGVILDDMFWWIFSVTTVGSCFWEEEFLVY